jgi:hypothetical protein
MATVMFSCGTVNRRGICRAIVGRWIKVDKRLRPAGVAQLDDFIREHGERYNQTRKLWKKATDNADIDRRNGLNPAEVLEIKGQNLTTQWVAERCAAGRWYSILGAWGTDFKITGKGMSEHDREGHAMGFCTVKDHYRFIDPNSNCWSFTNSLDMVTFLPTYLSTTYPELFNLKLWITRFAP